jgi:hypothetical protein
MGKVTFFVTGRAGKTETLVNGTCKITGGNNESPGIFQLLECRRGGVAGEAVLVGFLSQHPVPGVQENRSQRQNHSQQAAIETLHQRTLSLNGRAGG